MKSVNQTVAKALTVFGVAVIVTPFALGLSGCGGEEKQTVVPNPTPTAVPGGNMPQGDYAAEMQKRAQQMGR